MLLPFADVPIEPADAGSMNSGLGVWIAGGFLLLTLVLGIVWGRRPKESDSA